MLEDLISAFLRSQFGNVKRRTTGAFLEAAALGMLGLATVFLSIAVFLWLAARLQAWQAALIVGATALFLAVLLMLVGRSLLRRKDRERHKDMNSALDALSVLMGQGPKDPNGKEGAEETGITTVGAALTAGILLGRSVKR